MNDTATGKLSATFPSALDRQAKTGLVLTIVVLGGYWMLVFNQLRVDWSINPQYYYGWIVPLLALGSFQLRWASRPAANPLPHGMGFVLLAGALLAILLPIRLIEEANPEWRLIMWVHASQMVLITLGVLYYSGGRAWAAHFAFPVCFFFVAVPWPVPLEQTIIQDLMHAIAALTVETVGLLDIPAAQQGSVIQISAGVVGIDEACSGVRSVQTTLFVSLFLGELYKFPVGRRVGLTATSILLALVGNLGRTTSLVWCAARQGMARMHDLHDTAGLVALAGTMLGCWGLAQCFRIRLPGRPATPVPPPSARQVPRMVLYSLIGWAFVVEAATEVWYRSHESRTSENVRWTVSLPAGESQFSEVPISDTVRSILRYNTGEAAVWEDPAGNRWQLFMFRWEPGRNSAQLATAHTPDICLQAAGYQLTDELGVHVVTVQGLKLPIRQSVFTHGGETLHVFYCLWEDHRAMEASQAPQEGVTGMRGRLDAILKGRRHLGQQVLEIAVRGPATAQEAMADFERQISQLLRQP
jgi:exosortase